MNARSSLRSLVLTSLCAFGFASIASAAPLDPLLSRTDLWNLTQDGFEQLPEAGEFRWTSAAKDSARQAGSEMTLLGLPTVETVVRFEAGKARELTVVIYARGDAGGIGKTEYDALVRKSVEALTTFTKVKFAPRGKDPKNAVKADGVVWQTPTSRYVLEYSFTREVKTRNIPFRAEFIRLEISPPEREPAMITSSAMSSAAAAKFTPAAHIDATDPKGDIVLKDVPMVDQGEKGYCAVACAERVMRYYGVQTDSNELAQIANTDASRGTSSDAMMAALKKVSSRFKVRIRSVDELDIRKVQNMITEYNRAAKKGDRAPQIPDQGNRIMLSVVYASMRPEILKEIKTRNKSDVTRMEKDIETHISKGAPLLWSVYLGLIPEQGLSQQASGGHMRLIIGHNPKTQEIIYTDSWGAGHERKRMALTDAITITTGLTAIEPY